METKAGLADGQAPSADNAQQLKIPFVRFARGWDHRKSKVSGSVGTSIEWSRPVEFTQSALDTAFPLVVTHDKDANNLISSAVYKLGGTRGADGIETLHALWLDYDKVPPGTLNRLLSQMPKAWAWWAYTTWSHMNPAAVRKPWAESYWGRHECFRFVFPLSRGVSPQEWKAGCQAFVAGLGDLVRVEGFDAKVSETAAQGWFMPSCPPGLEDESTSAVNVGSPVNADAFPAAPTSAAPRRELPKKTRPLKRVTREDVGALVAWKSRVGVREDGDKKKKAERIAYAGQAFLDGRSPAPVGHRRFAVRAFVKSLVCSIHRKHDADVDVDELGLFEPSLAAMRAEHVDSPTDTRWLADIFLEARDDNWHDSLEAEREEGLLDIESLYDDASRGGVDRCAHTDSGNAERLMKRHGGRFRHVALWGACLAWDRQRWVRDHQETHLSKAAKETVRNIYRSAEEEPDEDKAKALRSWARASESRTARNNMMSLFLRSELPLTLHMSLDADPLLFNVLNGTIDLRTGVLKRHDPADLITKIAPVNFDPDAACPTWEKFIREVTEGRVELAEYIQRAVGYSLTGDVREHALFLLHGDGCNGKSVLVGVLLSMLGDYAGKAPMDLLVRTVHGKHETGMAKLHGLRLAAVTETEEGSSLAESVVKELTGGDRVTARRMREDHWEFHPTHKFWVCANHEPQVRGGDEGIWRRLKKIPFAASFKGREDRGLSAKLEAELPGILAWAVRGCLAWQRDGLREPADVQDATNEYRNEHDLVGRFLSERCVRGDDQRVTCQEIRQAFDAWCVGQDEPAMKPKAFATRLRALGARKVSSVRGDEDKTPREGWAGVALLKEPKSKPSIADSIIN